MGYTISINEAVRGGLGTASNELDDSKMDHLRAVQTLISVTTIALLTANSLTTPRTYCYSSRWRALKHQ